MLTRAKMVNTIDEVRETVEVFHTDGYGGENTFVLAHEAKRTDLVSDVTNASQIGIQEEAEFTALAHLFKCCGDELRSKMRSMGIDQAYAEDLEEQLNKGRIAIIAFGGNPDRIKSA